MVIYSSRPRSGTGATTLAGSHRSFTVVAGRRGSGVFARASSIRIGTPTAAVAVAGATATVPSHDYWYVVSIASRSRKPVSKTLATDATNRPADVDCWTADCGGFVGKTRHQAGGLILIDSSCASNTNFAVVLRLALLFGN